MTGGTESTGFEPETDTPLNPCTRCNGSGTEPATGDRVTVGRDDLRDALTLIALHVPVAFRPSVIVDRLSAAVGPAPAAEPDPPLETIPLFDTEGTPQ